MKLFLVSKSPRRAEILSKFGYKFEIVSPVNEDRMTKKKFEPVEIMRVARAKLGGIEREGVLLAADTVVIIDGDVLPKPSSLKEARKFLKALSGKIHKVYTAYVLKKVPNGRELGKIECTEVKFKDLSESEIEWLINVDNPFDKAGGYAIQGAAGLFIEWIKGDYYNVIGLPISSVYKSLKDFGVLPQGLKVGK